MKYRIRLGPTSNAFLPGHRIRLDVTSSDFPNYDRNHNTAADQNADAELVVARQTVHHGKALSVQAHSALGVRPRQRWNRGQLRAKPERGMGASGRINPTER